MEIPIRDVVKMLSGVCREFKCREVLRLGSAGGSLRSDDKLLKGLAGTRRDLPLSPGLRLET